MIEAVNANGRAGSQRRPSERRQRHQRRRDGRRGPRTETVTFFRRKPAHLLLPAECIAVGAVADYRIDCRVLSEFTPGPSKMSRPFWQTVFPVPQVDGHKICPAAMLS